MRHEIQSPHEIEKAPVYVLMRDKTLSGWGPSSGRDTYYLAACADHGEAAFVIAKAKNGRRDRIEQIDGGVRAGRKRVAKLFTATPRPLLLEMSRETAPAWYAVAS